MDSLTVFILLFLFTASIFVESIFIAVFSKSEIHLKHPNRIRFIFSLACCILCLFVSYLLSLTNASTNTESEQVTQEYYDKGYDEGYTAGYKKGVKKGIKKERKAIAAQEKLVDSPMETSAGT